MKLRYLFLAITLAAVTQIATAQNTIKLFDAMPIDVSPDTQMRTFGLKQIYLSCPTQVPVQARLTGPNGGPFIVDNAIFINRDWAGAVDRLFLDTINDPMYLVGNAMEASYLGTQPLDVSGQIASSGLYTFELIDWGYTFGSTDVYLNTSCTISLTPPAPETGSTQICHRNMGNALWKTLTVGPNAVTAHLAHGDTLGPCSQ